MARSMSSCIAPLPMRPNPAAADAGRGEVGDNSTDCDDVDAEGAARVARAEEAVLEPALRTADAVAAALSLEKVLEEIWGEAEPLRW